MTIYNFSNGILRLKLQWVSFGIFMCAFSNIYLEFYSTVFQLKWNYKKSVWAVFLLVVINIHKNNCNSNNKVMCSINQIYLGKLNLKLFALRGFRILANMWKKIFFFKKYRLVCNILPFLRYFDPELLGWRTESHIHISV